MDPPPVDDKIAAIMAKLHHPERKKEERPIVPKDDEKPPTTLEEFMKLENLDEWPQRLTSEGPMDLQDELLLLGSKNDIIELLRESAPLGVEKLEEVERRLEALEETLKYYASKIVTEEHRDSRLQEGLFYSPSRTFMTEISGSDVVKSHHSSKGHKSLSEMITGLVTAAEREGLRHELIADFVDSLMETRKKSLEYCQFPGFQHGELCELPGQLESPPILHRVTKAQDFNPGFKKFWKKLFLSEASVAMMQDTFWWFFLDKFDTSKPIDKNLLYDRIADSYVALFTSINEDVKDKFLMEYPDCLAQAVFSAYWEAFPESRAKFSDQMRQDLINTICEWTTGVKPVPGTFKGWSLRRLQSKPSKGLEKEQSRTAEQMMQAAALNKELNYSLDVDSFTKMVEKMGTDQVSYGVTPVGMARDLTRLTNTSSQVPTTVSQSRLATAGTSRRKPVESHQIGPGPTYERVKFNIQGRSPLISHYLHLRKLRDMHQPGKKVRRTEIVKLPSPGPTYRQLIQNTLAMTKALSKEYQRICEQTDQEILELEKKQIAANREFNALTKELLFTKNPADLRILSDKIIGLRKVKSQKKRKRLFNLNFTMNTVYCWFDWDDNTTTVNSINIIKEPRKPWMEYKTGEKVLAKLPQFGLWRGVIVEISESKKDLVQKMTTRQKNAAALVSNDDVQNEADDDDNGTNEDNLAQKITSDFGVLKNKIPEENKRKPKRKIMDDFVESEEHVSTKTGKSTSKGKVTKVKDTARIGEEKPGKEKTEKKKTDKEEVIKERKEKENSRMATMTNCASFILDTIACSQTVSTNNEVQVASNKHAEISAMHDDTHSDQSDSYSKTHLHADRNIMHDTGKQQASPLTASPVSVPPQKDYLKSIHSPQPMYPPFSFMPSPHAYSQIPYYSHLDNQYPFQESYPFYNKSSSFNSSLPPFSTNPVSSPQPTPNPETNAPSTKELNTGSLIKDSLSVAEYDTYGTCQECVLKDTQLESLTEANEKAQTDIQALHQRIRELEGEIANIRQSRQEESHRRHEEPVNHYSPARGPQIELCRFDKDRDTPLLQEDSKHQQELPDESSDDDLSSQGSYGE